MLSSITVTSSTPKHSTVSVESRGSKSKFRQASSFHLFHKIRINLTWNLREPSLEVAFERATGNNYENEGALATPALQLQYPIYFIPTHNEIKKEKLLLPAKCCIVRLLYTMNWAHSIHFISIEMCCQKYCLCLFQCFFASKLCQMTPSSMMWCLSCMFKIKWFQWVPLLY